MKILNGAAFKKMLLSGAANLSNRHHEIDALNVFPVPDGDTGTNMSLTIMAAAKEVLDATISEQVEMTSEDINAAATTLNDCNLLINLPVAGNYYRIAYNYNGTIKYVQATASGAQDKANAMSMTEEKGAASIFFFADGKLLSYTAGTYVKEEGDVRGLQEIGTAGEVTFEVGSALGTIAIKAPHYMHANSHNGIDFIDHCGGAGHDAHNFIIEEVEALPVTISAAKWASFYAPVAVTLPEVVKAYYTIGEKDEETGKYLQFKEIENGIVPAKTGVMLNGEATTYSFTITTTETVIEGNLFQGTTATTDIPVAGTYYILAIGENGVGLYADADEQNFRNNSHKAYYFVEGELQAVSYGFDFGGTTAIEGVEAVAGEKAIYDLTGRKIDAITAPGLYIINGVKTIVE